MICNDSVKYEKWAVSQTILAISDYTFFAVLLEFELRTCLK